MPQANEPRIEEHITLEAHMGTTTQIPIVLFSSTGHPQPFSAYFTPESSMQFNVRPFEGFLPPKPGAWDRPVPPALHISYSCRDLMRVQKGTLVVRVEGCQYVFYLLGHIPDYQPPEGHEIVDDRLTKAMTRRLVNANTPTALNYVIDNIREAGKSPPRRPLM